MDNTETENLLHDELATAADSVGRRPHAPVTGRWRYWKDLLCISVSFLGIMIPYLALQNLSSTLYQQAGLGVAALACVYAGVFTCCLLAPAAIALANCKLMMVCGFMAQAVFTASNAYPRFYTLLPASVLIGSMSAFMWTAQGSYVTALAKDYAQVTQQSDVVVLNRFNGLFMFFFQNSQIWGNLLTSFILQQHRNHPGFVDLVHVPISPVCGADFCSDTTTNNTAAATRNFEFVRARNLEAYVLSTTKDPPKQLIYTMVAVFFTIDVLAILVTAIFASNRQTESVNSTIREMILATLKIHSNKSMMLLLPMFVWNGMEQAYIFSEYTQVLDVTSFPVNVLEWLLKC